jgi:hypothetical protein
MARQMPDHSGRVIGSNAVVQAKDHLLTAARDKQLQNVGMHVGRTHYLAVVISDKLQAHQIASLQ